MTSDFQHCLDLLDDYRRGQLGSSEKATLEAHLQQCPECRAELEFRNELALSLRQSLPAAQPSQALSPAVLSAISSVVQTLPQRPKNKLLPWMLSAAAVVIVLIAFVQQRGPEIADDSRIVTLYSEVDREPSGAMKTELAFDESGPQETGTAESASEKLLLAPASPEQESDLAMANQVKPQQELAKESKKEYGYAAVPALPRSAQVPAAASAPAVARRELGLTGANSSDHKRKSGESSEYAASASVAGEAQASAVAQPANDSYYMESRTSSADVQTSAAVTSGTLSTTNTLTTGSR